MEGGPCALPHFPYLPPSEGPARVGINREAKTKKEGEGEMHSGFGVGCGTDSGEEALICVLWILFDF